MTIHNAEIARIFEEIADLLEIDGANPFRVRAYRDAARTINALSQNVADMVEEDKDLTRLSDIGDSIAEKIEEFVNTGTLEQLEVLKQQVPPESTDLLDVAGLGPQRIRKLQESLDITDMDDLAQAAQQKKIREVEGFGKKLEAQILDDLSRAESEQGRIQLDTAQQTAEPLVDYLRELDVINKLVVAGSYRRRKETIGDLDLVVTASDGPAVMDHFTNYGRVADVLSKGDTRSTVVLKSGLQVDLRVVEPHSFGAALMYLTGSKAHSVALRNMAVDQDLKINEYGVFKDDERIAGETEEEIYALFALPLIPPELREDRGEIEAAQKGNLPDLITLDDLRGNLHAHTTASDGRAPLKKMAQAAKERGLEYLAITDHSPHIAVTNGLNPDRLAKQIDEIDRLNDELEDITLLKGIEVDILEDGSLDLPNDSLKKLDIVVAAVHANFKLSAEKQTKRLLRALDNPYVNILGHPTGRHIGKRGSIEADVEAVMEAALENGCFLEANAQPKRLDLNDIHCKMAKEMGLKIAVSADAHSPADLDSLRFGVDQARRGWLTADDVINTRKLSDLKSLLKRV